MNELTNILIVPSIAGVIWALAQAGFPKKLQPIAALVLGVAIQCGLAYKSGASPDYANQALIGLGSGLMAAGYQAAHPPVAAAAKAIKRKASGIRAPQVRFQTPVSVGRDPQPPTPAL